MVNEVYETETFSKIHVTCEKTEQDWIEKMKDQIVEDLSVGKPLRFDFFREKKFRGKRLFYLVNHSSKKAILLAFGSKKEQQKIIEHILENKERYMQLIN